MKESYDDIKKPIEICLEIKHETDLALHVTDGVTELQWIPKSEVYLMEDGGPGDTIDIAMPEWLAMEKGFI